MILLLLASVTADPDRLLRNARALLSPPCEGPECAAPADARFRIEGDSGAGITAKDRAIRDDGSRCNVVGARRCTKRGRTIFRADLGR